MSPGETSNGLKLMVEAVTEPLNGSWDALADRLSTPPFMRPGWLEAWAEAFSHAPLEALTARRGADLVGVLPFVERRGVRSAPVNWHTPLFGFLAADREISMKLADAFVSSTRVRADLSFMDRTDPNLLICRTAAERLGKPSILREVMRSPYVPIDGHDWDAYVASLSRKFRKELGRCRRRLDEEGPVTVEMTEGSTDFERLLEEGFALEASGWKDERGSAINSDPRALRFYSAVARWARSRGWLSLAFLRLDGTPIAFDLCLQADGVTYVLKGGFDPAFRRFSPGTLLTYESLRGAFERRQDSYEFLGGQDPYKLAWTDEVHERVRFQAFGRTPRGLVNHLAWSRGRSAVVRARSLATRSRAGARA